MQIQIPHKNLSPLTSHDYSRIYDALQRSLSSDAELFAPRKAGFGGILQWDLPLNIVWTSITEASPWDRTEATQKYEDIYQRATSILGHNKELIDAVFSIPSAEYLYCGRDDKGNIKICMAAWGYSYLNAVAINPLTWHPEGEQNVVVHFTENSMPRPVEAEITFSTQFSKRIATDPSGHLAIGTYRPGTTIKFYIPEFDRNLSLVVEKGREIYTIDLTPAPVIPSPQPELQPQAPVQPEAAKLNLRLFGYDETPIANSPVKIIQHDYTLTTAVTDTSGSVTIDASSLPINTALKIVVDNKHNSYPPASFSIEAGEFEYHLHYHREKNKSMLSTWLTILAAIVLAALGVWLLLDFPLGLLIFTVSTCAFLLMAADARHHYLSGIHLSRPLLYIAAIIGAPGALLGQILWPVHNSAGQSSRLLPVLITSAVASCALTAVLCFI